MVVIVVKHEMFVLSVCQYAPLNKLDAGIWKQL